MEEKILFPFSEIRKAQHELIQDIAGCVREKKHFLGHAPTGLGKTAASLSAVLDFAIANGLKVFFLTSRHSHHHLCIETLRAIRKKFDMELSACDLIGKHGMCLQEGIRGLPNNDFMEYCKSLREKRQCTFFLNTKNTMGLPSLGAEQTISKSQQIGPVHVEDFISLCRQEKICPYYTAEMAAKKAHVIIGDYFYLFSPAIRKALLPKIDCALEKSIIIVDEAHNLPKRCRELLSYELSSVMVDRGIKEAIKFGIADIEKIFRKLSSVFEKLGEALEEGQQEILIQREQLSALISEAAEYDALVEMLDDAAAIVRKEQRISYLGSIGEFLRAWKGEDSGFARIFQMKQGRQEIFFTVLYQCLDPSLVSREVIDSAYSVLCMSGTLLPTEMYADLLGFRNAKQATYLSPFPKHHRLSLVVPETSSKYARRSEGEFKKTGALAADIANSIPGNVMMFFPSYDLRNKVYPYFQEACRKKILIEQPGLSKEAKHQLLEEFKAHHRDGAILLAIASGSFGEGVDLPGAYLKGVIVVGLPLEKPSLEVKELVNYYESKFGKGMEYGYIFPAIIRTIQNAGRLIRSATDKGVVVFLDERYASQGILDCFPAEYDIEVTQDYKGEIEAFFKKHFPEGPEIKGS
ncbi:ATP-dependent DNA helicase [Candidatus Woesearchaeota archaeon]|nr:ATP-dependent DNA helicase [Candidatus Woesearchaeota archaeon]